LSTNGAGDAAARPAAPPDAFLRVFDPELRRLYRSGIRSGAFRRRIFIAFPARLGNIVANIVDE